MHFRLFYFFLKVFNYKILLDFKFYPTSFLRLIDFGHHVFANVILMFYLSGRLNLNL